MGPAGFGDLLVKYNLPQTALLSEIPRKAREITGNTDARIGIDADVVSMRVRSRTARDNPRLPTVIAASLTFLCETFLRHGFADVTVRSERS